MVKFRGEGAMTDVNLIVAVYGDGVSKDGKSVRLTPQLDHRDPRAAGQGNLFLVNEPFERKDGSKGHSNKGFYSLQPKNEGEKSQFEVLAEAASSEPGHDIQLPPNDKGEPGPRVMSVKANCFFNKQGQAVINTSKPVGPGLPIDEKILEQQFNAAKEAREAKKAAQAEAPQAATPQAEAPQAAAQTEAPALTPQEAGRNLVTPNAYSAPPAESAEASQDQPGLG